MAKELNEQRKNKKRKIATILFIILLVIFLILIAVAVSYIADFYIYRNSDKNGLLWTVQQRAHGLLGIF
ncbi:hypothetical protein JV175_02170 [Mycoplasma gypis]|nr:hypothetical protein [[Mycoplasma] gypis]